MDAAKKRFFLLQAAAWILFMGMFFYYISERLYKMEVAYRVGITLSSFFSYGMIIYGYVYILYPRYRKQQKPYSWLVGHSFLLFAGSVLLRMYIENKWVRPLTVKGGSIFDFGRTHFAYVVTTSLLAFVIGFLFTAVEEKIIIQKRQEILRRQQLEAELQMLKYQLQPHFLFNFLNNLYARVYMTLPDVAMQIEKGAELMRYYLYNANKRTVALSSETAYIHNLIELEKSRLSVDFEIVSCIRIEQDQMIPPMLFTPLLENLFKHGIPLSGNNNKATITLIATSTGIHFSLVNPLSHQVKKNHSVGVGLKNLHERLHILYGKRFTLTTEEKETHYSTTLILPVYED